MFRVKASASYGPLLDVILRLFHQLSPLQATARIWYIIWIGSGPLTRRTWLAEEHVAALERESWSVRRGSKNVESVEERILGCWSNLAKKTGN